MTAHAMTPDQRGEVPSDDAHLQHHFDDLDQQHNASMLAMWAFLATEVLFFGGLIMAFVVYRFLYPNDFRAAANHLNVTLGGINTTVLLISSLTMAFAVRAAQLRQRKRVVALLVATMVFGAGFLVIKGFEWHHDYEVGLIPFVNWDWQKAQEYAHGTNAGPEHAETTPIDPSHAAGAGPQAVERRGDWFDPGLAQPPGVVDPVLDRYLGETPRSDTDHKARLFFVLYFFMTGLHAIHMIIGLVLVSIIAALVWTGWFSGTGETQVEVTGLYWHFIDIVWVFLYPLLYLIDFQT